MEKIKVILVEDQKIVRMGLISLLKDINQVSVVGDVENAADLFQLLKTELPDIVLTDIQLPGMSGLEITKVLKKDFPLVKVLILSGSYDDTVLFHAIKSGICGFLHKNVGKKELVLAIETVRNGKEYFSSQIKEKIMKNYLKSAREGEMEIENDELSIRELEVLKNLAIGYTISETADTLCLSYSTVVSHKTKIMQKLQIKSNIDLVKYAIKNNIIES
jgi:DNA-binding NarL/FixJ family response regulator